MKTTNYFKIIGLIVLFGCSKPNSETDFFFLKQDNENFTIEVTGNIDSKIFIINFTKSNYIKLFNRDKDKNFFETIDSKYATVYFQYSDCTDEDDGFVYANKVIKRLDFLVEVLQLEYGDDIDIFLLSKNFKANISLLYADVGIHKNKINGVLINNAFPDLQTVANLSKSKIIEHTQHIIDEKESIDAIGNAIVDTISSFTINDNNTAFDYYYYLEDNYYFNDYFDDVAEICIPLLPLDVNENFVYRDMELTCQENFSINENILNIKSPVGLFWEEHELLVPNSIAKEIYKNLPTEKKELYFFEKFCFPFFEDEDQSFTKKVIEFVEKYK